MRERHFLLINHEAQGISEKKDIKNGTYKWSVFYTIKSLVSKKIYKTKNIQICVL
jgi:hypothetical protein